MAIRLKTKTFHGFKVEWQTDGTVRVRWDLVWDGQDAETFSNYQAAKDCIVEYTNEGAAS